MRLEQRKVIELRPNPDNPRVLSQRAVEAVRESIKEFGYIVPIIVDETNLVLAGHTRLEALKKEGATEVEVVVLRELTEEQKRVLNVADNKTAELNEWDEQKLADITKGIEDDLKRYGFSQEELNNLLKLQVEETDDDDAPGVPLVPTTRVGDTYIMGEHRLVCGDSLQADTYIKLLEGDKAALMFTDPPYNVN